MRGFVNSSSARPSSTWRTSAGPRRRTREHTRWPSHGLTTSRSPGLAPISSIPSTTSKIPVIRTPYSRRLRLESPARRYGEPPAKRHVWIGRSVFLAAAGVMLTMLVSGLGLSL